MISELRKHVKGKAFKVLLWFVLISLVGGTSIALFIQNIFKKKEVEGIAQVDGQTISMQEFRQQYIPLVQFIRQAKKQYGPQADLILGLWGIDATKKPEDVVLDGLVNEKIMLSASHALKTHVSQGYADQKLHDPLFVRDHLSQLVPPQAMQNGQLDVGLLASYLERQGISEGEFDAMLRHTIERYLLLQLIQGAGYIPLAEAKAYYNQAYAKKKFGIVTVPFEQYQIKAKAEKFDDAAIEKYFNMHREAFRVPQKRAGSLWTFTPEQYNVTVSDKEIDKYYMTHKAEFVVKPEELKDNKKADNKAAQYKSLADVKAVIIGKLKQATFEKDFATDAQRVISQSRDIPDLFKQFASGKKAFEQPIALMAADQNQKSQKLFSLAAAGDKASYVTDNKGYIVTLSEIKESYVPQLADVKAEVIKAMVREKAHELLQADLKKLAEQPQKLEKLAVDFKGTYQVTDWLSMDDKATAKFFKDKDIQAQQAFGIAKKDGVVDVITPKAGYVIVLKDVQPFNAGEFAKKQKEIVSRLKGMQEQRISQTILDALKAKAKVEKNPALLRRATARA